MIHFVFITLEKYFTENGYYPIDLVV